MEDWRAWLIIGLDLLEIAAILWYFGPRRKKR